VSERAAGRAGACARVLLRLLRVLPSCYLDPIIMHVAITDWMSQPYTSGQLLENKGQSLLT
jgi:hypothetical protein